MNCPECDNQISDKEILKEAAKINGKKTKGRKRSDLKKGGKTWLKIHRSSCKTDCINYDQEKCGECSESGGSEKVGCYINHK